MEVNLRGRLKMEECRKRGFPAEEAASAKWTDERHCLYLISMEESFVNQLYGHESLSGDLVGRVAEMRRKKFHGSPSAQKEEKVSHASAQPGLSIDGQAGSTAEYSDQNFVDDEDEAKLSRKLKYVAKTKKVEGTDDAVNGYIR